MHARRPGAGLLCMLASLLALGLLAGGPTAKADGLPRRIVNGWLPYWSMPNAVTSVTQNADLWAEGSPLWYQVTGATAIGLHTGAGDVTVTDALRSRGVKVVPTVAESLDAAGMAALLRDPGQRAAHVQALAGLVTANAYDGIDLDYESMNFGGTATDEATVRSGFVTLVGELGAALHARGRLLSVSVGPRTRADDPNWSVHDYAGLAPSVDRLRVMAYNYHWGGGPAGAIAPVWWVDKVLAYAVTAVPAGKLELGAPLYGYDWPADPTQPDGYGTATGRTYAQAEALRVQYGATRQWSGVDELGRPTAAPWFTYTTPQGVQHVVWYNDADATSAKMTFIDKYHLRGLVFWSAGYEDARQWSVLRDYATQKSTTLAVRAPAVVAHGTTVTVSGRLATTSGAAVPGQKVALQWRAAGSTAWQGVATGTTSSTGSVAFGATPATNGSYRLVAPASWSYLPATSQAVTTLVRWRVSAAFDDATVSRGTAARLHGSVAPVRAGTAVGRQRYLGGRWVTVGSTTVRPDGTYGFTFTWSTAGSYAYRVVVPGTALNATGYSQPVKLSVS
jgi:spore germination protein YaaH